MSIDGAWPLIGKSATEADVAQLMRDNLLPSTKYQPGFTPVVVNTGSQISLFDAGNGERGFVPRPASNRIRLLYTSPSPRDRQKPRMPSSA